MNAGLICVLRRRFSRGEHGANRQIAFLLISIADLGTLRESRAPRVDSMSSITCPKCSSKLKLDEIVPGKILTCTRCRRRLRVNESGTAAVVDLPGPGAAKAESQTIRPAQSEPPRKKVARGFSGWAI